VEGEHCPTGAEGKNIYIRCDETDCCDTSPLLIHPFCRDDRSALRYENWISRIICHRLHLSNMSQCTDPNGEGSRYEDPSTWSHAVTTKQITDFYRDVKRKRLILPPTSTALKATRALSDNKASRTSHSLISALTLKRGTPVLLPKTLIRDFVLRCPVCEGCVERLRVS
jgi:hypothetical protein